MRDDFDPYRVLGLPVGASKRDIQKRYRKLLRTHHPDVAQDPERAHHFAAEIGRAYRILMDDARRAAYEREVFSGLDPDLQVVVERADPARSPVNRLLERARRRLVERRYEDLQLVCAEILTHDPDCAEAYELLGKAYEHLGQRELSREMYQEAQRLAGVGRAPYRQAATSIPRTGATSHSAERAQPLWPPQPVRIRWPLALGVPALAIGLLLLGRVLGSGASGLLGAPLPGVACGVAAAFVLAAGLAASGLLATFDQELGSPVGSGVMTTPLWLLILVATFISPALAAAFHLTAALLNDRLSRHYAAFWLSLGALTAASALVLETTTRFLWLGANLLGIAALAGWALGSAFSPREWWR